MRFWSAAASAAWPIWTGSPASRYEHHRPGQLVHLDVKRLGNIPAGGGHRFLGRAAGRRNH
jgi:hypothetical protein